MQDTRLVVRGCDGCPMHQCDDDMIHSCRLHCGQPGGNKISVSIMVGPTPEWCPLRKGDVTMTLEEGG